MQEEHAVSGVLRGGGGGGWGGGGGGGQIWGLEHPPGLSDNHEANLHVAISTGLAN